MVIWLLRFRDWDRCLWSGKRLREKNRTIVVSDGSFFSSSLNRWSTSLGEIASAKWVEQTAGPDMFSMIMSAISAKAVRGIPWLADNMPRTWLGMRFIHRVDSISSGTFSPAKLCISRKRLDGRPSPSSIQVISLFNCHSFDSENLEISCCLNVAYLSFMGGFWTKSATSLSISGSSVAMTALNLLTSETIRWFGTAPPPVRTKELGWFAKCWQA